MARVDEFSAAAVEIARLKWIVDELSRGLVSLEVGIDMGQIRAAKVARTLVAETLAPFEALPPDAFGMEDLAQYRPERWREIVSWLDLPHQGDCTSAPCTCSCCVAEMYFGIDTSPRAVARKEGRQGRGTAPEPARE